MITHLPVWIIVVVTRLSSVDLSFISGRGGTRVPCLKRYCPPRKHVCLPHGLREGGQILSYSLIF